MLRPTFSRGFRTFSPALFKAGDIIPTGLQGLHESGPGNSVDIGREVSHGKYVIVGLPAAFSPTCSENHIPGYVSNLDKLKAKGVKQVFVTCVNDSFVTQAWGESLNVPSDVRIIADTQGEFAKAGDHLFEAKHVFGNDRSIRYALIIENGKVIKEFAEPDKIGLKVSAVENILKEL